MSKAGVDAAVEAEAEAGHKRWWRWPRPRADRVPTSYKQTANLSIVIYHE